MAFGPFWCQWETAPLSVQRNITSLVSGTMRIKSPIWIGLNCDPSQPDVNQDIPFSTEFRAPESSISPSLWTIFNDLNCNFLYWFTLGMWRNVAGGLLGSCHFSPAKVPSTAFHATLQGQDCDCEYIEKNILPLRTDSSDLFIWDIKSHGRDLQLILSYATIISSFFGLKVVKLSSRYILE